MNRGRPGVEHDMRTVTVQRTIDAPSDSVWAVLADFPNISSWNNGVKHSEATSPATEGLGATRHCDLAPIGALEETITGWEPGEKLVVRIDSAAKLPMTSALATFELEAEGSSTNTNLRYEYQTRFGPLGALMGPMLDKQFSKGFAGFLADLEVAAQTRTTT